MLSKIFDLVRDNAQNAVVQNPSIPDDRNDEAIKAGGASIISTLQSALASGRLNDVLGYFKSGGAGNSPLVGEAVSNYSSELKNKFGIDDRQAGDLASKVIPGTMTQFANKTSDPDDHGFDIQQIFDELSGGRTKGLDLKNLLSRFGLGNLDKDGDGDVDLKDLKNIFGGGGAGGVIGGLFK